MYLVKRQLKVKLGSSFKRIYAFLNVFVIVFWRVMENPKCAPLTICKDNGESSFLLGYIGIKRYLHCTTTYERIVIFN